MIPEFTSRYLKSHNDNEVLKILIEKGIAEEKVIRNYMLISDYNQMQVDNEYLPGYLKKSAFQIWMELAEKYEISERQAQGIIQKWRKPIIARIKKHNFFNISIAIKRIMPRRILLYAE